MLYGDDVEGKLPLTVSNANAAMIARGGIYAAAIPKEGLIQDPGRHRLNLRKRFSALITTGSKAKPRPPQNLSRRK